MAEETRYKLPTCEPKMKTIEVGMDDMTKLRKMVDFRRVRKKQVRDLRLALERGETFTGAFIINRVEDNRCDGGWRMVLVDGIHRASAIVQFLEEHPDAKVLMRCMMWDNLSHEEEIGLFITHNKVVSPSQNDVAHVLQKGSIVLDCIKNDPDFPCEVLIYGGKNAASFSSVALAYMARNAPGHYTSRDWAEKSLSLTRGDYASIKQWLQVTVTAFGNPGRGNHWWGQTSLSAIAKIYFANVERIGGSKLVERFKKKVVCNGPLYTEVARLKAGGNLKHILERMLEAANSGYRNAINILIAPKEAPPVEKSEENRGEAGNHGEATDNCRRRPELERATGSVSG